jgi:hypothetical protein
LTADVPLPAYVPPTAFLTLPTVYSSSYFASLFHPATTSELHSTGVLSDTQLTWLIARPYSHDLLTETPFAAELPRLHQRSKPGLQSLGPNADPLALTDVLRPPAPRSPLELSNPAGLSIAPWARLHVPSTHGLASGPSQ